MDISQQGRLTRRGGLGVGLCIMGYEVRIDMVTPGIGLESHIQPGSRFAAERLKVKSTQVGRSWIAWWACETQADGASGGNHRVTSNDSAWHRCRMRQQTGGLHGIASTEAWAAWRSTKHTPHPWGEGVRTHCACIPFEPQPSRIGSSVTPCSDWHLHVSDGLCGRLVRYGLRR